MLATLRLAALGLAVASVWLSKAYIGDVLGHPDPAPAWLLTLITAGPAAIVTFAVGRRFRERPAADRVFASVILSGAAGAVSVTGYLWLRVVTASLPDPSEYGQFGVTFGGTFGAMFGAAFFLLLVPGDGTEELIKKAVGMSLSSRHRTKLSFLSTVAALIGSLAGTI